MSVVLATLTALAAPTAAQAVTFTGTRENVSPLVTGGRCVPRYGATVVVSPGNFSSTGVSNFGAFTSTQSHCNAARVGFTEQLEGIFTYDFAVGDSLFGIFTGRSTPPTTPGFNVFQDLTVTGGTGRFLRASGFITSMGTLRGGQVNGVPVGIVQASLAGQLNLPAVPEPSTWLSMILGFGVIGAVIRRRHRRVSLILAKC